MFEKDQQALYFGVTALENVFITEYMPSAKGEYVKVYLTALYYSQGAINPITVKGMAKMLEMQENDVEAALRYWERRSLMARVQEDPPTYKLFSIAQRMLTGQDLNHDVDKEYTDFAESVYAIFRDKRKVRPSEISLAYEWVQDLGLSKEAVFMLLNHMAMTGGIQFSFKRAQTLAVKMQEEKVKTFEDAERFLLYYGEIQKGTQNLVRRLGQKRLPTEDELILYRKWRRVYLFEEEGILSACALTTAGAQPTFKYLDGILTRIYKETNARTKEQVDKYLRQQDKESELVSEFLQVLGLRSTVSAVAPVYLDMAKSMPHSVIILAARECNKLGYHTLDKVQTLLLSWEEKHLKTQESVQIYLEKVSAQNNFLVKMFENCGYNGKPSVKDRELLSSWREEGFEDSVLLLAAEQAYAVQNSKMRYVAKVLSNWKNVRAFTLQEAKNQLLPQVNKDKPQGKRVSAQNYNQREYSQEELDRLSNMDDIMKEASKRQ